MFKVQGCGADMATISRFEEIESWKLARMLTKRIYECTGQDRFSRDFGLKDQIRRASVSTMSNIAEGFERGGNQEFVQFLATAKGSCGEVRSQLYIALDQGYITAKQFDELNDHAARTSKLIAGFMEYLKKSELRGSKFVKQKRA
jgi:four helix bundle protein